MTVLIGTSGWQYQHWRERFYPKGFGQTRWLEFYTRRFQTVEVNNTFYHLPKAETFAKWRERTPADFVVVVKASRYLTHIKRLREPQEPVQRLMERARLLGEKLGPVLIQLPPNLEADASALDETLNEFGNVASNVPLTVEFRHASWFNDDVRSLLEQHRAAFCLADRGGVLGPVWRTADWGYVRFHQGWDAPVPCYSRSDMAEWARRIADLWGRDEDVYVFFNNDPEGCAIRDAIVFAEEAVNVGLVVTRVPDMSEVRVGELGETG